MRVDIVGVGWLFDPERLESGEFTAHAAGVGQVPMLIGIEHQSSVVADDFAQHCGPPQVARFIR